MNLRSQMQQPPGDYRDDDLPWEEDQPTAASTTTAGRGNAAAGGRGGEHQHEHDANALDENAAVLTMVKVTVRSSVAYGGGAGPNRKAWNGRGGAVALLNRYAKGTFIDCYFIGNEAWGGEESDDDGTAGYYNSNGGAGSDSAGGYGGEECPFA